LNLNGGVLVGLLGSAEWEIHLTGRSDTLSRTETIEAVGDEVLAAVNALPPRSLSRMSSKTSLANAQRLGRKSNTPVLECMFLPFLRRDTVG
jgi:hypothetical protein